VKEALVRTQPEEKAPDTLPVPTPPPESAERRPDVTVVPPKRGVGRRRRSAPAATVDEMLAEIERKDGDVAPELVVLVLRSYRALEATNRALKEEMAKHVKELGRLKVKRR
jgi:hypothetical protein